MISCRLKSEDNGFEWFFFVGSSLIITKLLFEIIFKYINLSDSMEGTFDYDVRQDKYFENDNNILECNNYIISYLYCWLII